MGNAIGKKKKSCKVMKIDGTTFKVKPPTTASHVLLHHPGFTLLDADDVKLSGIRSLPLHPNSPLKPGHLYFLVELPRLPDRRVQRRAWSGQLNVTAKDRLETLRITRRSVSDLSLNNGPPKPDAVEEMKDGTVRLRVRLPKAEVERLMKESKDAVEAAERIMVLASAPTTPRATPGTPRTTPGTPMMLRSPEIGRMMKSPEIRRSMKSPEMGFGSASVGAKEKRTRFVALPDEIIA